MRSVGNCGHGEHGEQHEPREPVIRPEIIDDGGGPPVQIVHEVAWHNGKNASATGSKAVARAKARRDESARTRTGANDEGTADA